MVALVSDSKCSSPVNASDKIHAIPALSWFIAM